MFNLNCYKFSGSYVFLNDAMILPRFNFSALKWDLQTKTSIYVALYYYCSLSDCMTSKMH